MPFAEGETLRDRLDRETQLSIEDALQIAQQVADAPAGLTIRHAAGIAASIADVPVPPRLNLSVDPVEILLADRNSGR